MIKNHLIQSFEKELKYTPTSNQQVLFEKLAHFIVNQKQGEIFLIKGYAGTGKTSSVSAVVRSLKEFKINCVLLAPTGRAAKVISAYSHKQAFTIHKRIYFQKYRRDGTLGRSLSEHIQGVTLYFDIHQPALEHLHR